MTDYPIVVSRFTPKQALTIVCERCGAEETLEPDELLNEGLYECPADTELGRRASTAPRCRGSAVMKYEEGDTCPSCGRLGFWDRALNRCCSRKCMLQAEYAESLKRARLLNNAT
jgi:hypothetical protein